MNQIKTFIFSGLFVGLLFPTTGYSSLKRSLKPNEIKALKRNVQNNPENLKSRLFLGHHYHRNSNWKKVAEYLGPVAERLPDGPLFKLGQSYLKLGQFLDAESIANILLSKDQVLTKHYLLAVKIYAGILETASLETYQLEVDKKKTVQVDPKKPISDKLFNTLKMAQKQDPENADIYEVWLDMLETHVEHFAFDGLRVMEDMRKNNIRFSPRMLSLQCKFHFLAEYTKQAKLSCQQAISQDPGNSSNYIYLGQTQVSIGEEKEGKRMLASVGKKFSSSEEALWATADSYYQSKNVSSAYAYFKKASKHKDAQPRDFLGLAKTAFELKKYGEALNAFVRHCKAAGVFHQEFRRASGLLKDNTQWQDLYRQKMMDCKPKTSN